jgi:hypothetical protein
MESRSSLNDEHELVHPIYLKGKTIMRKNLLIASLIGLSIISLTACSRDDDRNTDQNTPTTALTAPEPTPADQATPPAPAATDTTANQMNNNTQPMDTQSPSSTMDNSAAPTDTQPTMPAPTDNNTPNNPMPDQTQPAQPMPNNGMNPNAPTDNTMPPPADNSGTVQ